MIASLPSPSSADGVCVCVCESALRVEGRGGEGLVLSGGPQGLRLSPGGDD